MQISIVQKVVIKAVAIAEIVIGFFIFGAFWIDLFNKFYEYPLSAVFFVSITSLISVAIGVGLLNYQELARKVLVFFAGYIIISKVLIFSGIITFEAETLRVVSTTLKDIISLAYHIAVLFLLNLRSVKKLFF